MKNNYIGQGWLILLLAIVFGGTLALVQMKLGPMIEQNKKADTMTQIPGLVPGAISGEGQQLGDVLAYKALADDGKQVGWVAYGKGGGYSADIELLVGLDMDLSKITGIYVLSQQETPGLGNKIIDAPFRDQFKGKTTTKPLSVTKNNDAGPDNQKIDALTGATVSSKAVTHIVEEAIAALKAELAKGEK